MEGLTLQREAEGHSDDDDDDDDGDFSSDWVKLFQCRSGEGCCSRY